MIGYNRNIVIRVVAVISRKVGMPMVFDTRKGITAMSVSQALTLMLTFGLFILAFLTYIDTRK